MMSKGREISAPDAEMNMDMKASKQASRILDKDKTQGQGLGLGLDESCRADEQLSNWNGLTPGQVLHAW